MSQLRWLLYNWFVLFRTFKRLKLTSKPGVIFILTDRVLISGDFNVPLLSLDYSRKSDRTEVLLKYLMITNMSIMNSPDSEHTYVQDDRKSRPELTLTGLDVLSLLDN